MNHTYNLRSSKHTIPIEQKSNKKARIEQNIKITNKQDLILTQDILFEYIGKIIHEKQDACIGVKYADCDKHIIYTINKKHNSYNITYEFYDELPKKFNGHVIRLNTILNPCCTYVYSDCEYENGAENGICIKYYPNGTIKLICNYKDNQLDGHLISFHKNGTKNFEGNYLNDSPHGHFIMHYINEEYDYVHV